MNLFLVGGCSLFLLLSTGESHSQNSQVRRQLSYEWIAGYEPRTLVTDHAAIDLDQEEMERLLSYRRLQQFRAIYEQGGHSQSIAKVNLIDAEPPILPIPKNTRVIGAAANGDVIRGKLVEEAFWAQDDKDVTLHIGYEASNEQANYVGCQVGGLVSVNSTNEEGCKYVILSQ